MNWLRILPFFLILSTSILAQSEGINQYDANNEKTGWWIIYMDKNLKTVEDSSEASYYRYGYFIGKFNYYSMGPIGTRRNPMVPPESQQNSNSLILLNGTYEGHYSNGRVRFRLKAKDGKFISYEEFYKTDVLKTFFDYTTSCGSTEFNFCISEYNKDGSLKEESTIRNPPE